MARPQGNKGPEAISPAAPQDAEWAGQALTAAMRNNWSLAMAHLAQMTPDALETLASVAPRFGHRASSVGYDRLKAARRGQIEDRPPCGHPLEHMWLTRSQVICACTAAWSRGMYPETEARIVALHPQLHCHHWRPGDPVDRFHGRSCGRTRSAAAAAARVESTRAERMEQLLRGELTEANGLDMPWDPKDGTGSQKRMMTRREMGSPGFDVHIPGMDDDRGQS